MVAVMAVVMEAERVAAAKEVAAKVAVRAAVVRVAAAKAEATAVVKEAETAVAARAAAGSAAAMAAAAMEAAMAAMAAALASRRGAHLHLSNLRHHRRVVRPPVIEAPCPPRAYEPELYLLALVHVNVGLGEAHEADELVPRRRAALSDTSKPISPVTVRTCTVTEKSC